MRYKITTGRYKAAIMRRNKLNWRYKSAIMSTTISYPFHYSTLKQKCIKLAWKCKKKNKQKSKWNFCRHRFPVALTTRSHLFSPHL